MGDANGLLDCFFFFDGCWIAHRLSPAGMPTWWRPMPCWVAPELAILIGLFCGSCWAYHVKAKIKFFLKENCMTVFLCGFHEVWSIRRFPTCQQQLWWGKATKQLGLTFSNVISNSELVLRLYVPVWGLFKMMQLFELSGFDHNRTVFHNTFREQFFL